MMEIRNDYDEERGCGLIVGYVVVVLLILCFCLCSCQSVKYVPVETVRTEYIHNTDTLLRSDSVFVRDSIFTLIKGDSVIVNKISVQYRDRVIYKSKTDTILKQDTITKIVEVKTEKKPTLWQRIKNGVADITMTVCLLLLIFGGIKMAVRKK